MELVRTRHKALLKNRPFGTDIVLLFVLAAVAAAGDKGLPTTASKIAFYLELPRETVRRKLRELVGLGLIIQEGKAFSQTAEPMTKWQIEHMGKLIREAATALAHFEQNLSGVSVSRSLTNVPSNSNKKHNGVSNAGGGKGN